MSREKGLRLVLTGAAFFASLWIAVGNLAPALAQDVDVQAILRCVDHEEVGPAECDRARQLVLYNCTSCHTFVPIVLQQFDLGAWTGILDRHRDRAKYLTAEEFEAIRQYLAANFNQHLDPPHVPAAIAGTWTDCHYGCM